MKSKNTYGQKGGPIRYSNEYNDWHAAAIRNDERGMRDADERYNRMIRRQEPVARFNEHKAELDLLGSQERPKSTAEGRRVERLLQRSPRKELCSKPVFDLDGNIMYVHHNVEE